MELKDLTAAWGALTGTLALCISYMNFRRDSSKLNLLIRLSPCSSYNKPEPHYLFRLQAVNEGRRVIYITRISIKLPETTKCLVLKDDSIEIKEAETKLLVEDTWDEQFAMMFGYSVLVRVEDSKGKNYYSHVDIPSLDHLKAIQGHNKSTKFEKS